VLDEITTADMGAIAVHSYEVASQVLTAKKTYFPPMQKTFRKYLLLKIHDAGRPVAPVVFRSKHVAQATALIRTDWIDRAYGISSEKSSEAVPVREAPEVADSTGSDFRRDLESRMQKIREEASEKDKSPISPNSLKIDSPLPQIPHIDDVKQPLEE